MRQQSERPARRRGGANRRTDTPMISHGEPTWRIRGRLYRLDPDRIWWNAFALLLLATDILLWQGVIR